MVDGAVATGSFVYDADTNTYSQIDIQTSGGTLFAPAHYITTAPVAGVLSYSSRAILVTTGAGALFGTPALALYPALPLSNAGGTINLFGSSLSVSFETTCGGFTNDCDGPGFDRRNFVSGVVTTVVPAIPTLSEWTLVFLAALLLMSGAWLLWRAPRTYTV